jgi:hypothetical protein
VCRLLKQYLFDFMIIVELNYIENEDEMQTTFQTDKYILIQQNILYQLSK